MKNIVKYIAAIFFLTSGCVETIPEVSQERNLNLSRIGDLVLITGAPAVKPINGARIKVFAPECNYTQDYNLFDTRNAYVRYESAVVNYNTDPQRYYLDYPMRNSNGTWNAYMWRGDFISFALDAQQAGCNIGNMIIVYKFQDLVSGTPMNGTYETRIVSVREHLTP